MINSQDTALKDGATIVVAHSLLAAQYEAYLWPETTKQHVIAHSGAPVLTYQAWVRELWTTLDGADTPNLLTARQEEAIWRQVVQEAEIPSVPITNLANVSRWAADAWRLVQQWNLGPLEKMGLLPGEESRALILWHKRFDAILRKRNWIDLSQLEGFLVSHLSSFSEAPVIWAQFFEETPAQKNLFDHLLSCGWKMLRWADQKEPSKPCRISVSDESGEIKAAACWAASQLENTDASRIAVVVSDLDRRRSQVHRVFNDILSPEDVLLGSKVEMNCWQDGSEELRGFPALEAALTALELFSSSGSASTFSRWLRSPFFSDKFGSADDRAFLEADLRDQLFSQLRFRDAISTGDLSSYLNHHAPVIDGVIKNLAALVYSAPHRRTPTQWISVWQKILSDMEWLSGLEVDQSNETNQLWESALCDFASLTSVVGSISINAALREIQQILQGHRSILPIPLRGVYLLGRIEDVGPGYDGVWVTGMTDGRWPEVRDLNPLLPRSLLLSHDVPGSSPHNSLERSRALTNQLLSNSPTVIFSWPKMIRDYPVNPSPLILTATPCQIDDVFDGTERRLSRQLFGALPKENLEDEAPPLSGDFISGGVRTLNTQAVCPLVAFCEQRLGAKPLEKGRRGLGYRRRGMITHRAMELAWRRFSNREAIHNMSKVERDEWFKACAGQALHEVFGSLRDQLRVMHDLELARLQVLLAALADCDVQRSGFEVEALEKKITTKLNGFILVSRIDRVDRLESGGLAIIDYKTGSQARPADWLKSSLTDVQIPLYTLAVEESVTAAVIGILRPAGTRYRGIWEPVDVFPGSPENLDRYQGNWVSQQKMWKHRLENLLKEFSRGDVRLSMPELDRAKGAFAPLTRVYEQVVLAQSKCTPRDVDER